MDEAKGKYVIFVDSDDVIREDTLEITFNKAEEYDADIIYFDYDIKHLGGEVVVVKSPTINYEGVTGVYKGTEIFAKLQREGRFVAMACFRLYRKSFLREQGLRFKEGILHEDYLFSFLCVMKAQRVVCVPEVLYLYIKHEGAITSKYTHRRVQSLYLVIYSIIDYWKRNNFGKEISEAIWSYLDFLFSYCRQIIEHVGDEDALPCGQDADKYLYKLFQMVREKQPEYIALTDEFVANIKKWHKRFIYGAGNYGKELLRKLSRERVYVEDFLVSELDDPGLLCEGKRVIQLDDWKYDKDALIIIAISPRHRDEAVETLKERGYFNYVLLPKKEE